MRIAVINVTVVAGLGLAAWGGYRLWPRTLEFHPRALIPVWSSIDGKQALAPPDRFLVAQIGEYDDELFAYLMFQYFAGAKQFRHSEVMLTYRRSAGALTYPIEAQLAPNLLESYPLLAEARAAGLIRDFDWRYLTGTARDDLRHQSKVFETAYNLSAQRKIEEMSRAELLAYVRRFVRFKSTVDPRIRRKIEPIPKPLSQDEAHQLAADILTVADFYSLPLDFFLGIGAMENNYMNVKGDLQHAVWKKRADKGDMVLQRKRGRVLVLNPANGVWQITRETLRYVHNLYLADRRDYSTLPERLRPPRELNLDEPDPEMLTTYAGLLFRQLLDRFHGDVATAVGAYNGGPGNPNPKYEEGARRVAEYARRILQQAAMLHGRPAAGTQFLSAGR